MNFFRDTCGYLAAFPSVGRRKLHVSSVSSKEVLKVLGATAWHPLQAQGQPHGTVPLSKGSQCLARTFMDLTKIPLFLLMKAGLSSEVQM